MISSLTVVEIFFSALKPSNGMTFLYITHYGLKQYIAALDRSETLKICVIETAISILVFITRHVSF